MFIKGIGLGVSGLITLKGVLGSKSIKKKGRNFQVADDFLRMNLSVLLILLNDFFKLKHLFFL